MKSFITVGLLLICTLNSNGQIFERIFDNSESVLSEDEIENIITRYNSISLILDTLAFMTNVKAADYYVNLRVRYFSYSSEKVSFLLPQT